MARYRRDKAHIPAFNTRLCHNAADCSKIGVNLAPQVRYTSFIPAGCMILQYMLVSISILLS
jgi:hypothetical protein